jgi:CRP/FNR family transcriptional regulator, nitrogen oxide reductase regulator
MAGYANSPRLPEEPFRSRPNGADRPTLVYRNHGDNHGAAVALRPPLFSSISAGDYAAISAAARVKDFARGEMLYFEGDAVRQVLLLTSGCVKITQLGLGGAEVILRLGAVGDVIGAGDLFSIGRHRTTAEAFRLCRGLVWDAAAFRALVERFPVLHQNMVRILDGHLLELEQRFREVATERVGPRVARQLMRLQEKIGQLVNGVIEIGLSREELAQMTGTTLFTVSRLLSSWEARGMVRPRRESVTICDIESLRAVSEEG